MQLDPVLLRLPPIGTLDWILELNRDQDPHALPRQTNRDSEDLGQ